MLERVPPHEWHTRAAGHGAEPFLYPFWEEELMRAFPYLTIGHYRLGDDFLVRGAHIGERITTVPFCDGGDVLSLSGAPLSLRAFQNKCRAQFGDGALFHVHTFFCPVKEEQALSAPLVDYRIVLGDMTLHSFRKTLRHMVKQTPPNTAVRTLSSHRDTLRAYALYLDTMRRTRALALPKDMFVSRAEHRTTRTLIFEHNGAVRAFALFCISKGRWYYFLSGSDRAARTLHAPHHLLWRALRDARRDGAREMLLGGTRKDGELNIFKRGWRGIPHDVYAVSSGRTRERARRSPLRSLWGLMPPALIPHMSQLAGKYVF